MTRIVRRAVLIASIVITATAIAVAHGVSRTSDGTSEPSATERFDAYDGGPVPIRKLHEPIEPILSPLRPIARHASQYAQPRAS